MSIKPILFNTEMVRAILDGRKTVTRRKIDVDISNQFDIEVDGTVICYIDQATGDSHKHINLCRYHPGDILYVRETFVKADDGYHYRADATTDSERLRKDYGYKYRPSIHMSKEAARIWLKVTNVRVERLQDITGEQAVMEGTKEKFPPLAQDEFRGIWDSTVKKADIERYAWKSNPWVWVIEFERCEKPQEVLK